MFSGVHKAQSCFGLLQMQIQSHANLRKGSRSHALRLPGLWKTQVQKMYSCLAWVIDLNPGSSASQTRLTHDHVLKRYSQLL